MADEVPVLEPGMKVRWKYGHDAPYVLVVAEPDEANEVVVKSADGYYFQPDIDDISPLPQVATFSLDLGDGRCGSVEVSVDVVERIARSASLGAETYNAVYGLVRDVVQGKGED